MCGICGILEFGSDSVISEELLKKMCSVLEHRGPDDEGIYINKWNSPYSTTPSVNRDSPLVGLGHRRLAVIDLKTGHQPMSNENQTVWIVQNGEIYNFGELRENLEKKGHKFKTNSDTEVIIHLYEDYGKDCVKYLRGMFAFAIWDGNRNRLLLARDRIGEKPVCYALTSDKIIFASEIKSILQVPDFKREVDFLAMHHYLTYQYVPSPFSIFKGINKLPAAHILVWEKGNLKVEQYWTLDYINKIKISENEAQEQIIQKLKETTQLRLISDVPLGAFLSGGIDSSAVVAMMSQLRSQPVKTFSIGFEEQDFSEIKYARMVAERYNTEHKEFIVKPPKVTEILPKLVWYYNEPFADSSAIPTYYVSKITREYVTVALNGDGGDENFAGYPRYQQRKLVDTFVKFYTLCPEFFKKRIRKFVANKSEESNFWKKVEWLIQTYRIAPERRYARFMTVFPNDYKNSLYSVALQEELGKIDSIDLLVEAYEKIKASDFVEKIIGSDIITYLPDCLCVKMDIASMANSLETRSPLLDYKFMEFTASLPSNFKLRGYITKYIFKKALEKYLPKKILYRKKMGFGIPFTHWFKDKLKNYVYETLLGEDARRRNYFNIEYVKQILDEHTSGKIDHTTRIWALLNLELWHQIFIDSSPLRD